MAKDPGEKLERRLAEYEKARSARASTASVPAGANTGARDLAALSTFDSLEKIDAELRALRAERRALKRLRKAITGWTPAEPPSPAKDAVPAPSPKPTSKPAPARKPSPEALRTARMRLANAPATAAGTKPEGASRRGRSTKTAAPASEAKPRSTRPKAVGETPSARASSKAGAVRPRPSKPRPAGSDAATPAKSRRGRPPKAR